MNNDSFTSLETAAPDINALISYLVEKDTGRFLYRGQVKEYPKPLVPSIFRGKLKISERYKIDSQTNAKTLRSLGKTFFGNYAQEMSELRFSSTKGNSSSFLNRKMLFERLLDIWGYMIGSTLAQHYGIGSGLLDVSTDVKVAAFFATHSGPIYEPVIQPGTRESNTDHSEYGIIYKFNRFDLLQKTDDLDKYNYWNAPGTIVPGEFLLDIEDDVTIEDSWQSLRYFYEMFKASSERCWSLLKIPKQCIKNSRIGRQKAAFLVSDELHNWASNKYAFGPIFGEPRLNLNQELQLQAIEDLGEREGTVKYYFKHTDSISVIDISPEYLWPKEDDLLLKTIVFLISKNFSNYIETKNEIPDSYTFIDPGVGRKLDRQTSLLPNFINSWDDAGLSIYYSSNLQHTEDRLTYLIKKAAILCLKGYTAQQVSLLQSAIKLLQEAISIDTDSVVLLLLKSMIHHDLGENTAGAKAFNKSMDVIIRDTMKAHKQVTDGIEIQKRIARDLGGIRYNPNFPQLLWEYYQSF